VTGAVGEIRFNRPQRLNALDVSLGEAFRKAVETLTENGAVSVIVLRGEGRAFMAGGGLDHFRKTDDKAAAAMDLIGPAHAALTRLAEAPQIVIASVHGPVAGAGMSITLGADLAVAADTTVFNFAYGRIGASPDCGGSWALPRLVGPRRALEIALFSESIDAAEALRLGLVNRVVPLGDLATTTDALAARLAQGPAVSQGRIKALMRNALDRSYPEQLAAEAESFATCARTADFAEAIDAFFAKRPATFTGPGSVKPSPKPAE
jgi:2-(1,2-epoxy-1,2-dihydrophenyl)acetyl-CoA isomerase